MLLFDYFRTMLKKEKKLTNYERELLNTLISTSPLSLGIIHNSLGGNALLQNR